MRLYGDSTSDPVLFTSIEVDTGVPIENPARNRISCSGELDSKFGSSFFAVNFLIIDAEYIINV